MGLTIHYNLHSKVRNPDKARDLVRRLRSRALNLPVETVEEIVEVTGGEADFNERDPMDDPLLGLLLAAKGWVTRSVPTGTAHYYVIPTHVIAFTIEVGEGCESASFGLCRYPATIEIEEKYCFGQPPRKKVLPTKLGGWRWGSFCKTQYASNPECGGVQNFLRCHLSVISMLDSARTLGILEEVCDEGDYWRNRDIRALVQQVGHWNDMPVDWAGKLADWFGGDVVAEVEEFSGTLS